ncbi:MAG: S8 family serine peptidase [Verrucomicrobia bacterium]|nr:S8 family serine peptidase [Verrucomicrobiota bacterium]
MAQVIFDEPGQSDIVTNLPGTFTSGTNVNTLVGANRFYNAGFTGQGTITANVEAGHIWSGHSTLGHVTSFAQDAAAWGSTAGDLFDRHATWVGQIIGGRATSPTAATYQQGIAYGTDLRSGAIATNWNGNAWSSSFSINVNSLNGGYQPYFGTADVINSSWGGTDPAGSSSWAVRMDGYAAQFSQTTFVVTAGNSGPGANTVGFPGSGYNAITVGALTNGGNNSYNAVATFSSRGPEDYFDPLHGTISGVRAAVDLAAPGDRLTAAYYGGQTGGNNTSLPGSAASGGPTFYSTNIQGTSFSAPIVAGGVALVKSASYNTAGLASNAASRDTLVVKSVLMNSADRITGWSNGQVANGNGLGGVVTTQALDWASGAGRLNLDRAFDQYLLAGTRDVAGLGSGDLGLVGNVGWDLGNVDLSGSNMYRIGGYLAANSRFDVSLNWFRDRIYNPANDAYADLGQADLTLRVVDLVSNTVISESASLYNTSELLSFVLPRTSQYGIEVVYGSNTFGSDAEVNYGIAWSGTAYLPDAGGSLLLVLLGVACMWLFFMGRARSR